MARMQHPTKPNSVSKESCFSTSTQISTDKKGTLLQKKRKELILRVKCSMVLSLRKIGKFAPIKLNKREEKAGQHPATGMCQSPIYECQVNCMEISRDNNEIFPHFQIPFVQGMTCFAFLPAGVNTG